ncbi:MAG: hypothetical protein HQK81_10860 [Desulfovibrionaceae bacterium]|nr:hypothetical protein [Desulfovibrionaceae bacterium]
MYLRFNDLMFGPDLGITDSERMRWVQGRFIPTKVLQQYFDEGLPFVPEAPFTHMRLDTFLKKLEVLSDGHLNAAIRQLAIVVRLDIASDVSGFDTRGKPDPRRRPKTKVLAKQQVWAGKGNRSRNWQGMKTGSN